VAKHDRVVTGVAAAPRRSVDGALLARNALPVRIAVLSVLSSAAILGTVPVAALGGLTAAACLFGAFEVRAVRAGRTTRRSRPSSTRAVGGRPRPAVRLV
jgi:hypothetical protein